MRLVNFSVWTVLAKVVSLKFGEKLSMVEVRYLHIFSISLALL